ncbi:hypothetical protein UFOVP182_27 [uncultured Caudovirales phage]|uniref:Uncharacterized protein n=1 Tax=uncultured Caudovirales phage TaxID=2100421 RepID=A0A6J7WGD5_9CAUD|nr:hypothetical protein UFOVP182_27 [uncultured Caudovirales phage]
MIILDKDTTSFVFNGFTNESKTFISTELCSLPAPIFLYEMTIYFPENALGTSYGTEQVSGLYGGEEFPHIQKVLWYNTANISTNDVTIELPISTTNPTAVGPVVLPGLQLPLGQYKYELRMIGICDSVSDPVYGLPTPFYSDLAYPDVWNSNQFGPNSIQGGTFSRFILDPSYLLETGRLTSLINPINTKVVEEYIMGDIYSGGTHSMPIDRGLWNSGDDDDVYL